MPSTEFNFDENVSEAVIIIDSITHEGYGILTTFLNSGFSEKERRNSIRKKWRNNNNAWKFDLQRLCENFIQQLLTQGMEYEFRFKTSGTPMKYEKESTYGEFEVNILASKRGEHCYTYTTQFLVAVNFNECKIIKETELF